MSYLDELLGEADGYFTAAQRDRKRERSQAAVRYDSFDSYVYSELAEEVPAFQEMIRTLDNKYDYVAPLPQDVLQFFWQADPMVRDPGDMDVIEAYHLGFSLGNAVKYILRAGRKDKDKHIEDLKKARWYVDREIQRLEGSNDDESGRPSRGDVAGTDRPATVYPPRPVRDAPQA